MSKKYDPVAIGLSVSRYSGDEAICYCPFHDDSHPSAAFNVFSGIFYCYTCKEALSASTVAKRLGGHIDYVPYVAEPIDSTDYGGWRTLLHLPLAFNNEYLASRQVTDFQVQKYDIRAYDNNIVFPLVDRFSIHCGVLIRKTDNSRPKYILLGQRPELYPYFNIDNDKIIVCEGIFGVLRLEKYGYNAISTLGTGRPDEKINILKSISCNVSTAFDCDLPGLLYAGKFAINGVPAHLTTKPVDEMSVCDINDLREKTLDLSKIINHASLSVRSKIYKKLRKYYDKQKYSG